MTETDRQVPVFLDTSKVRETDDEFYARTGEFPAYWTKARRNAQLERIKLRDELTAKGAIVVLRNEQLLYYMSNYR